MRTIDLAGEWQFALDPADEGISQHWFAQTLPQRLRLPGSLQEQGFGEDISIHTEWTGDIFDTTWFTEERYARYRQPGNVKIPFWLQPEKHYQGVAWYCREINIPAEWAGQRVTLTLERPHWETQVWIDGQFYGKQDGLGAPHVYDLGSLPQPGQHTLTLRVDNRRVIDVGSNSHSISDHTQSNWNGVAGRITLQATAPVWIDAVRLTSNVARRSVRVLARLGNQTGQAGAASLSLRAADCDPARARTLPALSWSGALPAEGTEIELEYELGPEARLWDEFDPALYRLDIELTAEIPGLPSLRHEHSEHFGLREVSIIDTQIAINGNRTFIRGTLECCIFPLTGYPPVDVESWRRILRVCKAHGLNALRFHSWCPPEAAFIAGDEEGVYFQIECSSWANMGVGLGEGQPVDAWLYAEAERILAANGNHPCFIMMAYGNEPGGNFVEYLTEWVRYWKARDPRRLHTSAAGWPALPESDYHNVPEPRIQGWGEGLNSRINGRPPETRTDYRDFVQQHGKAVVSHEIGQWCVYPNFAEIEKYSGYLKARNFEIFRETLQENHMGDQARDFLMASGKLQALCYKEEIEAALRTPGFAGFHLLDLHDFPGQGTALVGVLDPFWDSKGYISPEEYHRFCGPTVPLARLDKRLWRQDETLSADLELAHFGPSPLAETVIEWKLVGPEDEIAAQGAFPARDFPLGNAQAIGGVHIPLNKVAANRKYRLVVGLQDSEIENDWDVWVFPNSVETRAPQGVVISSSLDETLLATLAQGGKALLALPPQSISSPVALGFSSVFWNTAWTNNQAPHTLGLLLDPAHPLFSAFPTEYHTNYQWWELVHHAAALILDTLPAALRPLVQPIDTWFENRRLGLLFEAKVGAGRLAVCSMDLDHDLENRLAARQFRASLLAYLGSPEFAPEVELSPAELQAWLKTQTTANPS